MTVAVDNKDGCLNIPFKQPTRISRERTVTMYPTSDDYYNKQHPEQGDYPYCITFEEEYGYEEGGYDLSYPLYGLVALFNKAEDAQDVIKNPNFREILNLIYK